MSTAKKQWDDMTPELFIERVKALLVERGWTRKMLAEKMGIGVTGLILDKNKAFPSVKVMQKYANVFGVGIWEMIYDCGVSAVGVGGEATPLKWQTQEELNERIAAMMRRMGVTQAQLGQRLGISPSLMNANLQSANMSLLILIRLAKGLGIEPWELLIDREDMEREVRRRKGVTEGVQDIQRNEPSVKENVQQTQNKATGKVSEPESGLPWDDAEEAREADKRLSAIPLRVIRIIRCPYCNNEISIKE